ncbi:hypothetical protein [Streptomyces tremellae]|uniref:hypothetical protein n=1 Tax=Streptomyces tremellae TaxID=1124239 RepID=UPI0031E8AECA
MRGPDARSAAPRAAGRPPLGEPLAQLPPTAVALRAATDTAPDTASVPPLPVAQGRAVDASDASSTRQGPGDDAAPRPSGRRPRAGLGAPLASLPPSAGLPGTGRAAPAARGPAPRAPGPGSLGAPSSAPTGPARAPLLGRAPAAARLGESVAAPGASAPLVQRRASAPYDPPARQPSPRRASASGQNGGGPRPTAPSGRPAPVVVARAVPGGAHPGPARALRPTVRLLAARPLAVSTGAAGDMAPTAPPAPDRPVVAARWPRGPELPRASGTVPVVPAPAGAPPRVQRASAAPAPRVVRPAPATGGPPTAAPRRALPFTQPQSQLPTAQPSFTPATGSGGAPPAPVAPVARPARRVVQRDTGSAQGGGSGTGSAATRSTATSTAGTAVSAGTQTPPAPAGATGADLDDLARRLIDPVSRLLRSELRRGRERTGSPGDRRR